MGSHQPDLLDRLITPIPVFLQCGSFSQYRTVEPLEASHYLAFSARIEKQFGQDRIRRGCQPIPVARVPTPEAV